LQLRVQWCCSGEDLPCLGSCARSSGLSMSSRPLTYASGCCKMFLSVHASSSAISEGCYKEAPRLKSFVKQSHNAGRRYILWTCSPSYPRKTLLVIESCGPRPAPRLRRGGRSFRDPNGRKCGEVTFEIPVDTRPHAHLLLLLTRIPSTPIAARLHFATPP